MRHIEVIMLFRRIGNAVTVRGNLKMPRHVIGRQDLNNLLNAAL